MCFSEFKLHARAFPLFSQCQSLDIRLIISKVMVADLSKPETFKNAVQDVAYVFANITNDKATKPPDVHLQGHCLALK